MEKEKLTKEEKETMLHEKFMRELIQGLKWFLWTF